MKYSEGWKVPKSKEVVEHNDGITGMIIKTRRVLGSYIIDVENIHGVKIYVNEPVSNFRKVSRNELEEFHTIRLDALGFNLGSICSFKGAPLLLTRIRFTFGHRRPELFLKDLRFFEDTVIRTCKPSLLEPFKFDISLDLLKEDDLSKFKSNINFNIDEINIDSWVLKNKKKILTDLENWKSSLYIRKVTTIINDGWELKFPCWTVDVKMSEDKIFTRVRKIDHYIGFSIYYPSPMHAGIALSKIPQEIWASAYEYLHYI